MSSKMSRCNLKLLALSMAGVAALGLAAPTASASVSGAIVGDLHDIPDCTPVVALVVPGALNSLAAIPESIPHGLQTRKVTAKLEQRGVATRTLSYNATPWFMQSYERSQREGYHGGLSFLKQAARKCPDSDFALAGYSEGADIAGQIAEDVFDGRGPIQAKRLKAVSLLSDPHNGGTKIIGGASQSATGILGRRKYGSGADKVLNICDSEDWICNRDVLSKDATTKDATEPGRKFDPLRPMSAEVIQATENLPQFVENLPSFMQGDVYHVTYYPWVVDAMVDHIAAESPETSRG